jgi:hypothetical protein
MPRLLFGMFCLDHKPASLGVAIHATGADPQQAFAAARDEYAALMEIRLDRNRDPDMQEKLAALRAAKTISHLEEWISGYDNEMTPVFRWL